MKTREDVFTRKLSQVEYSVLSALAPIEREEGNGKGRIDDSTTHNAAGNITTVPQPGSWSSNYDLIYDAWNRLVEVKDGATTVAEYERDGLHRRTVKTVGGDVKHFYYNTRWQVVEVRDASETGTMVEEYVWHPYYVDALAVRYWDSDEDGDYASTDETHYFTHDANQNITAALQHGSAVKERYLYKPYGGVEVVTASFGAQSGSAIDNPYFFTGRRLDDETGLYHFRNRFYHAELGRFVSRDFLEYPDGMNLYGAYFVPGGLEPSGLRIKWIPQWLKDLHNAQIKAGSEIIGYGKEYIPYLYDDVVNQQTPLTIWLIPTIWNSKFKICKETLCT